MLKELFKILNFIINHSLIRIIPQVSKNANNEMLTNANIEHAWDFDLWYNFDQIVIYDRKIDKTFINLPIIFLLIVNFIVIFVNKHNFISIFEEGTLFSLEGHFVNKQNLIFLVWFKIYDWKYTQINYRYVLIKRRCCRNEKLI